MNIFSTIFAKPQPEPPPAPDPPVDREAELLEQLHAVDRELDSLGDEMKSFRSRNFGVVDGRVMVRGESASDAAQLREEWNQYLRRLTLSQQRRSQVLKSWSDLKTR